MVTNVVEVIFFACFIRYYTEKSLGVIPGILIAAAFFSLHHAGFQPEYIKSKKVGICHYTLCSKSLWLSLECLDYARASGA
jgi:hypothetical protein